MAPDTGKLVERFQTLLKQGHPPTDALLIVVHIALEEDRQDFAHQRDTRYSRIAICSVADDLLTRLRCEVPRLHPLRAPHLPTSFAHLAWMLQRVSSQSDKWPLDKLGRWLGYVQGVLTERGDISVEVERNRTRTVFQVAYAADGLTVPETEE